jgi:hypothetical protein
MGGPLKKWRIREDGLAHRRGFQLGCPGGKACAPRRQAKNALHYVALGVRPDGTKEVLGLWIEQTEGAKFWLRVMNGTSSRSAAYTTS